MTKILETAIEFLKGVGPERAKLLSSELGIKTFDHLIRYYPFRYEDRSQFYQINQIKTSNINVLIKGQITHWETIGDRNKKRLRAYFSDDSGEMELIWFRKTKWIEKYLKKNVDYVIFGKSSFFKHQLSIVHPEMELLSMYEQKPGKTLHPVYSTTEKLIRIGLDSKGISKMIASLMSKLKGIRLPDPLPTHLIESLHLVDQNIALRQIHFPESDTILRKVQNRIKFEELFFLQLELLYRYNTKRAKIKGPVFEHVGNYFNQFFNKNLAFELTGAQKRVIIEIRKDMGTGIQMNRLLQGDVGSGKTIVGLMSMLIALDNGYQCCLMAPTEILAQQHYHSIAKMVEGLDVKVGFLSGSIKGKKRKLLLEELAKGEIHILIGTHALIEDPVVFQNLGFAITDEQHRFGVHQRAKLWGKAKAHPPHILVMTATPIPRTLAMSYYGDLDISVIDELPPGRKAIETKHIYDTHRAQLIRFMKAEIKKVARIAIDID